MVAAAGMRGGGERINVIEGVAVFSGEAERAARPRARSRQTLQRLEGSLIPGVC